MKSCLLMILFQHNPGTFFNLYIGAKEEGEKGLVLTHIIGTLKNSLSTAHPSIPLVTHKDVNLETKFT